MKRIAAAIASLLLFPAMAQSQRVWTVVYKDWLPDRSIYRYTNFDLSSIIKNGDCVFASTLNNSSDDNRGGQIHTTVANCKEKSIKDNTHGSTYFRRNGGEWWVEVRLKESPRFVWYGGDDVTDIYTPEMIEGMKQSALNGDKCYEAMFTFLCGWK